MEFQTGLATPVQSFARYGFCRTKSYLVRWQSPLKPPYNTVNRRQIKNIAVNYFVFLPSVFLSCHHICIVLWLQSYISATSLSVFRHQTFVFDFTILFLLPPLLYICHQFSSFIAVRLLFCRQFLFLKDFHIFSFFWHCLHFPCFVIKLLPDFSISLNSSPAYFL